MKQEHKATWRYYFFLALFSVASALGLKAVGMLLGGEVTVGEEPMPRGLAAVLSTLLGVILLTYLETALVLLLQLLRHRGQLLRLSQRGIEHTLVFVNFFAVVLVLPVKCIPWDAVKDADLEKEPYIRVNAGKVKAGVLARLILWVVGFHFCYGFVKPAVSAEEIKQYKGTA